MLPPFPANSAAGNVFKDNAARFKFVADGIRRGKVAILARLRALPNQRLDLVIEKLFFPLAQHAHDVIEFLQ